MHETLEPRDRQKAGVLNFNREILQSVREGKYSSGEGRRIRWSPDGERNSLSRLSAVSLCLGRILNLGASFGKPSDKVTSDRICFIGTEDARRKTQITCGIHRRRSNIVLQYRESGFASHQRQRPDRIIDFRRLTLVATIGGKTGGITTRIKDFESPLRPTQRHSWKSLGHYYRQQRWDNPGY